MVFDIKNISIKKKIVLSMIVSTIFFIIVTYIISYGFIVNNYISLERSKVETNIVRIDNAFNNNLRQLGIKISDWSIWDDTYVFIKNKNKAYIESNLANTTLTNMDIHSMIFLDNNGDLVYQIAQDADGEPIYPEEILEYIKNNKKKFIFKSTDDSLSGLISLKTNDIIFVANPILRNDSSGPVAGTLVFVDFIDEHFIKKIGELTELSVNFYKYNSPSLAEDVLLAKESISLDNPYFIKELSEDSVAGYHILYDIENTPSSIFKVSVFRDIYKQGIKTLNIFIFIIILIIVIFGYINIISFNKLVISRLFQLGKEISEISSFLDESKRLTGTNNTDEIGDISQRVNQLLDRVYESEQQERKVAEELRAQAEEANKLNKLMIDRELKMLKLKEELDKLKNNKI